MEIVTCEECENKDTKSTVELKTVHTKPFPQKVFYDEDGVKHIHNPDMVVGVYMCSNGHSWYIMNYSHCPNPKCEWGSKELVKGET